MNRTLLALVSYLFADIVVYLFYSWNMTRFGLSIVIILFTVTFILNLVFLLFISTDINLAFKDPSMTLLQLLVALFFIFVTMYNIKVSRLSIQILFVFAYTFGFFRFNFAEFLRFSGIATAGYILTIYLLYINYPEDIDFKMELLSFLMFLLLSIWFAVIAGYFHNLRKNLKKAMNELKEANQRLEELATRDELTKIDNRRSILEFFYHQAKMCKRYNQSLSIVIGDIDWFKNINDTYGHNTGDEVLKAVAKILKGCLRDTDRIGRFGGEEFLVVLPNTDKAGARAWAERARELLESKDFNALAKGDRVTMSFGVAEVKDCNDPDTSIVEADKALYRAKREGRNRVVVHYDKEGP